MTRKNFGLFLATAALAAVGSLPLNADTLNLYLKVDGGAMTNVATSTNGVINYTSTSTPNYSSISINGSGTPALPEPGLDLNSLDVTTATGFSGSGLTIQLTEQGISTLTSPNQILEAFATILRGTGATISFSNYIDPTNGSESSGCTASCVLIGSYSTSAQGSTSFNMSGTQTFTNGSPFSETELITIGFTGSSQSAFGDDNITNAPEPMSLGLFGGGLALLGVARLRKGRKA
jgi:hypothetical protein